MKNSSAGWAGQNVAVLNHLSLPGCDFNAAGCASIAFQQRNRHTAGALSQTRVKRQVCRINSGAGLLRLRQKLLKLIIQTGSLGSQFAHSMILVSKRQFQRLLGLLDGARAVFHCNHRRKDWFFQPGDPSVQLREFVLQVTQFARIMDFAGVQALFSFSGLVLKLRPL